MTPGTSAGARRNGPHPTAARAEVRLTEPAFEDLQHLLKLDPQLLRQALKKLLLLERNPEAGEPLRGPLVTYRKLTLGNRDRRIIWRVTHEADGKVFVDIAEVWAVGARADAQVYDEMRVRVANMPPTPLTMMLTEVVERLGSAAGALGGETAADDAVEPEGTPEWLLERLVAQVGLTRSEASTLTRAEALQMWTAWAARSH